MKYSFILLCLFTACSGSDPFGGKRIVAISEKSGDSLIFGAEIKYNKSGLMTAYNDNKGLTIDSVAYQKDTVKMYKANEVWVYILQQGVAVNAFCDSPIVGYTSTSFHYLKGCLESVREMNSLSFKNSPDTLFSFTYNAEGEMLEFTDKQGQYLLMFSDHTTNYPTMPPMVNLGKYMPAFCAGLLGKLPKKHLSTSKQNGKETSYWYQQTDNKLHINALPSNKANEYSYIFR